MFIEILLGMGIFVWIILLLLNAAWYFNIFK